MVLRETPGNERVERASPAAYPPAMLPARLDQFIAPFDNLFYHVVFPPNVYRPANGMFWRDLSQANLNASLLY